MLETEQATWPPNVEIEFTRYWEEEDEAEMRERVLNVLSYFPEFEGKKLTIGLTRQAGTAGVHPRGDPRSNRNYIRLKVGASKFTIAHEFYHILTREKAIDIFTLSRSPYLIDRAPGYLDTPERVKEHPTVYRDTLHELAVQARERFVDEKEMVEWFEQTVKEEVERYDV